jgi:hypothetical protein
MKKEALGKHPEVFQTVLRYDNVSVKITTFT